MNRTSDSTDGDSNMASEGDNEEEARSLLPLEEVTRSRGCKSTVNKTLGDIRVMQRFFEELSETRKVHEIPYERLDDLLAKFLMVAKRKDGREYEPHTFRGMLGSMDRYLLRHNYPHTIYFGRKRDSFPKTRQVLRAKLMTPQREANAKGSGRMSRKSEPLLESEVDHLFLSGTLGLHSPTGLFNMIFFINGLHFGFSSKEHYELQWGDIKLFVDSFGVEYLEYCKTPMKKKMCDCGIMFSDGAARPRIYSNNGDLEKDPIVAYKKYWEKRQYMKNMPDSPFYLSPVADATHIISGWFSDRRVGVNKIKDVMARIKFQSGLADSKRFTNHSIRLTCSEKLGRSACTKCVAALGTPPMKRIKPCDVVSTTYGQSDGDETLSEIGFKIKEEEEDQVEEAVKIECRPQIEDTDVSEEEDSQNDEERIIRAPVVVNVTQSPDETITSTCTNTLAKIFPQGCVFHGPVNIHIYNHLPAPPPPPPPPAPPSSSS